MPRLHSQLDLSSQPHVENRERMLALVERFRDLENKVRFHSEQKAEAYHERGQLLPRERVDALLDRGTPFLELSSLAGYRMHDDDGERSITGGGLITGIGLVAGRQVMVTANDSAIKGGAVSPMGLKKNLRAQEIALRCRLPCIYLIESAGANLLHQSEVFVEGGRVFANMARLSAAGIPQVTVVHGSSTAGGAYLPGLSDYVVVVEGNSKIFLAGPPLVFAATGEQASDEALGGARMHMTVSGSAEYMARDDAEAIETARELLGKLAWDAGPCSAEYGLLEDAAPFYPADELLSVVPDDYRQPYDVREVLARLVDRSDFLEFKALFGPETVCGHARIGGQTCGLIGNNGPIFAAGAQKAAHFIQVCCQSGIPLVYLQNTPGYMVGVASEQAGIIKHGAKMLQAIANATVPQITVLIGGAFGAGNYGMCGRSFDPDFLFAWPNSRIGVMGAEQAAQVMELITKAKLARQGRAAEQGATGQASAAVARKLEGESDPLFATARLWDDGLIDPRDTRRVLAMVLSICREGRRRTLHPNTFGVARM